VIVERKGRIRLASASPRRHALFNLTGWAMVITPVKVDEDIHPGETPVHFAQRLALEKAETESRNTVNSDIILAADTIVVDGKRILGKPLDRTHAKQILLNLRGKKHLVITALALIDQKNNRQWIDMCETEVPMRMFSEEEIEAYIESGDPMDKAGAYGIQNTKFHPVAVERMMGCYANVMGLPLCHLQRAIKTFEVESPTNIPEKCMAFTQYDCQIYRDILQIK
jgi:septum formation protein